MKEQDPICFEVEGRLRRLRETLKDMEAPPRVEAALKAAFRQRETRTLEGGLFRSPWRWALMSAAAAVILVSIGGLWILRRPAPAPPPPAVFVPGLPAEAVWAAKARSAQRGPRPPATAPLRAAQEAATGAAPQSPPEIVTEFFAVTHPDTWPPNETGQILRVRVPRATLTMFGFPMNAELAEEPVRADVALGQDGTVRAIRFVQ